MMIVHGNNSGGDIYCNSSDDDNSGNVNDGYGYDSNGNNCNCNSLIFLVSSEPTISTHGHF